MKEASRILKISVQTFAGFLFNKQIKNLKVTSASSWCSINSFGERPWRLHSLDFTMMGTCPNDCLTIPLGTPLTDQLTSACVHKHKGNRGAHVSNTSNHAEIFWFIVQYVSLSYHKLSSVCTPPSSTLSRIDMKILADSSFGHRWVVYRSFHKR